MAQRIWRPDEAFTTPKGALTDQARNFLRRSAPTAPGSNGQVLVYVGDTPTPTDVADILPQVVVATTDTPVNNDTSTYAGTGLSASITLTSAASRVRIHAVVNGLAKLTNDTGIAIRLRRAGSTIAQWATNAGKTGTATDNRPGSVVGEIEETPGSVGPHTYTVEFNSTGNVARATVQESNARSSLTLTEVFV